MEKTIQLYLDREKTIKAFPKVKSKNVIMENNTTLENKIEDISSSLESNKDELNSYKIINDKEISILKRKTISLNSSQISEQYSLYSNTRFDIRESVFSLGFVTDTHFNNAELRPKNYNSLQELKMFKNVCDNTYIKDKYILGDLLNGDYTNATLFNDACEFNNNTEGYIKIHGNHDDGSYIENLQIKTPSVYGSRTNSRLNSLDIYSWFYKNNNVTKIDPYTMAFYKDYDSQKIRVIHINTSDLPTDRNADGTLKYNSINVYGLTPRQVKWHNENSFNFSDKGSDASNWKIIVISHIPLVQELATPNGITSDYPFYYNGLSGDSEFMANSGIIRQMIRNITNGTSKVLNSYIANVPTSSYGTHVKTIEGGTQTTTMTASMHSDNYKYFGTNYTIDGTTDVFSINFNISAIKVPVIACISGHMHTDSYYTMDTSIHHVTLSGTANSIEDDTPDINEYANTIMMIKDNEIFFFRQGRNRASVSNPILSGGVTNYGIEQFKDKRFTF